VDEIDEWASMKRMEEQGIISGMDAKWMKMVQEQGINSG
jgi:hypothetical protein